MRLQLYTLRELLVNFLLSAAFVYFVCVVGAVIQAFASGNVALIVAVKHAPMFLFLVSDILTPLAFLVAVLFTYGRMSADNEWVAMRACGIHPMRVLTPAVLLGLLVAAAQFRVLSETIPMLWLQKTRLAQELLLEQIRHLDPGKNEYKVPGSTFYMRWRHREGLRFEHVVLKHDAAEGSKTPSINGIADVVTIAFDDPDDASKPPDRRGISFAIQGLQSTEGKVEVENFTLLFAYASIYEHMNADSGFEAKLRFLRTDEIVSAAVRAGWRAKLWDPTETNGAESESASAPAKSSAAGNPWKVERRRNLVEVNRRAAWSMCALLFGLFGAPIALWLRRGTRLAAIVVALGIVFIVYFPLAKLGDALADVPSVPYWVAPWIATTVLAAMTGGLLFRLCRR